MTLLTRELQIGLIRGSAATLGDRAAQTLAPDVQIQTVFAQILSKNRESFLKPSFSMPVLLTLFVASIAAPAFSLDSSKVERKADGVTIHSANGMLHVAVCSERVIHVVASTTDVIPKSIVPAVIHPCGGAPFKVSTDASTVSIKTDAIRVEIDRAANSVRFLSVAGKPVLSEVPNGGRTLTPVNLDSTETYKIRQDFLLSPDEALYGLGQHQEGFFNVRDIPVRLLQANTNISIPFLISTNGYGLLWNNAALTDFDPASTAINLDEHGAGTFQTGSEGEYGFLLGGNFRRTLRSMTRH